MTRRLGMLLCSFALACCAVAPSFAARAQEREQAAEQEAARIRATLMETDQELAAVENAFTAARERFLALFSGLPQKWAAELIKRPSGYQNNIAYLVGEQGKRYRSTYLKNRVEATRYMELAAATPVTNPDFLILLRPVCLASAYYSDDNLITKTLAEYDARDKNHDAFAKAYQTRRVNGEYWALIRFDDRQMKSAGDSDNNMAFVLRVAGKAFTLHPIIAPSTESYYPGEKSPLQVENRVEGPREENIDECRMTTTLSVTGEEGPFAFRADAEQLFDGRRISYICEPKCTGFTYTWSEKSKTYLRKPGTCRDDDGWKPRSPFAGETLTPVANYAETLAKTDKALQKNEEALAAAWKSFQALFDEKTRQYLQKEYDAWRYDRQISLYRLVGKEGEFANAVLAGDKPVLEFMQRVAVLAAQPDARLLVLLDDAHKKVVAPPRTDNDRYDRDEEEGGYYYRSELLSGKKQPLLAQRFARQLALLQPPAPQTDKDRYNRAPVYTAKGLEGGASIVFTYENPDNAYRGRQEKLPGRTNSFTVRHGADGAYWGVTEQQVDPFRRGYSNDGRGAALRIIRVHGGKIAFVTPALPEEKSFFKNPELRRGKVVWRYPQTDRRYYYGECEMRPAFTLDTSKTPFGLTAVDQRLHGRAAPENSWQCIPECSIPFTWNGSAYVPGDPVCLPEGQWGAKEPAAPKKQ